MSDTPPELDHNLYGTGEKPLGALELEIQTMLAGHRLSEVYPALVIGLINWCVNAGKSKDDAFRLARHAAVDIISGTLANYEKGKEQHASMHITDADAPKN